MQWSLSGKQDVYLEIADKFEQYIRVGVYRNGEKLPSVRVAAKDFGVNPNTVARAYATLEERGVIRSLPKKGVFVTAGEQPSESLPAQIRDTLTQWKASGITEAKLTELLKEVYTEHDSDT